MLVGIFLSINHAVVEDTLVFAALGANPLVILATRFLVAILITRLAAYIMDRYTSYRPSGSPSMPSSENLK